MWLYVVMNLGTWVMMIGISVYTRDLSMLIVTVLLMGEMYYKIQGLE
jgi:hypothetical protein